MRSLSRRSLSCVTLHHTHSALCCVQFIDCNLGYQFRQEQCGGVGPPGRSNFYIQCSARAMCNNFIFTAPLGERKKLFGHCSTERTPGFCALCALIINLWGLCDECNVEFGFLMCSSAGPIISGGSRRVITLNFHFATGGSIWWGASHNRHGAYANTTLLKIQICDLSSWV